MDAALMLRAIGALLIVLGLLAAFALLLRRYGHRLGGMAFLEKNPSVARLAVTESRMVDARTKLLLIRRDDVEHLILVGPAGTTLVESGISRQGRP